MESYSIFRTPTSLRVWAFFVNVDSRNNYYPNSEDELKRYGSYTVTMYSFENSVSRGIMRFPELFRLGCAHIVGKAEAPKVFQLNADYVVLSLAFPIYRFNCIPSIVFIPIRVWVQRSYIFCLTWLCIENTFDTKRRDLSWLGWIFDGASSVTPHPYRGDPIVSHNRFPHVSLSRARAMNRWNFGQHRWTESPRVPCRSVFFLWLSLRRPMGAWLRAVQRAGYRCQGCESEDYRFIKIYRYIFTIYVYKYINVGVK